MFKCQWRNINFYNSCNISKSWIHGCKFAWTIIPLHLGDHQLDNEFDPIPRAGLETCCVRFSKGDYPTHLGKNLDRLVALVGMCSGNRRDVFGLQYEGSWLPPDSVVHHSTHWSLQSTHLSTVVLFYNIKHHKIIPKQSVGSNKHLENKAQGYTVDMSAT